MCAAVPLRVRLPACVCVCVCVRVRLRLREPTPKQSRPGALRGERRAVNTTGLSLNFNTVAKKGNTKANAIILLGGPLEQLDIGVGSILCRIF